MVQIQFKKCCKLYIFQLLKKKKSGYVMLQALCACTNEKLVWHILAAIEYFNISKCLYEYF